MLNLTPFTLLLGFMLMAPMAAGEEGDVAPPPAHQEETADTADTDTDETTAAGSAEPPPAAEPTETDRLQAELDALRAETTAQIETLKAEQEQRLDEIDEELMANAASATEAKRFEIYGFFDLTFHRDFPADDSLLHGLSPEVSSFVLSNINVYVKSQMTDSLSALVELRFTFLPHGHEVAFGPTEADYERVDTTVAYPYSNKMIKIGGVGIERAHLTWQPRDWFGVIAGYYLTPYGIWNVDHGTPVLITVREPWMQFSEIVPQHQLGLQLFGRIRSSDRFFLDYAFTVSNGRGPKDAVQDLDENKGLGLRLHMSFEGRNTNVSFGGYGYFGTYTDKFKVVAPRNGEFRVAKRIRESYSELIGAVDLLVEIHGVRLQSEYIRRLNKYDVRPERDAMTASTGYQPDYINHSVYTILGWELPLESLLDTLKIMPYVELDYTQNDDTIDGAKAIIFLGGLNLKPSPYVTLKAEGGFMNSIDGTQLDMAFLTGQMAVSF